MITKTSGGVIKNEIIWNKELPEELHKSVTRKFEKTKVQSPFICIIWGTDFADMQLISKFNKGIGFWLCVFDVFSKYAWLIPVKDKKGITITKAFQKILKESNRKLNKIWVDKSCEFYNRLTKSWLEKNDTEMYLKHNEGKSVVS